MRQTWSLVVLVSLLAGCATPVAVMPTVLPQAAPASVELPPVVATGSVQAPKLDAPGKAMATPGTMPTTPAPAVTPAATSRTPVSGPAKTDFTWMDFDPMAALASLPGNVPTGPDLADDDEDEVSIGFQTQGWLWGWGGTRGRDRGLRKFADEEGRIIELLQYPNGWTAMRAVLTPQEVPGAMALAVSPLYSRPATTYKHLPKHVGKQTTRHLKFFRKQKITPKAYSRHLMYHQVQQIGTTAIAGYIARAEQGMDRYIAYYDASGRFLWSYGSNYPMYGFAGMPDNPLISSTADTVDAL